MKKMFLLVVGMIVISSSVYAAGDLIVNGKLGVGTTSPEAKLDINTNAVIDVPIVKVVNNNGGFYTQGYFALSPNQQPNAPYAGYVVGKSWSHFNGGKMGFVWVGDQSPNNYLTFGGHGVEDILVATMGGNVGIGTAAPGAKLQVYGNAQLYAGAPGSSPKLYLGGETDSNAKAMYLDSWWIIVKGHGNEGIKFVDNTGDILAQFNGIGSNNGNVLLAPTSGNVGIGTTSPTEKLYVSGNIYATGSITPGCSRTLKENINELSLAEAIQTLKGLSPVTFNYKAEKVKDLHLGFIAEDVPELVATPDRKGVDPMDIVAVVTKVVKEQQKVIQEQNERIMKLEAALSEKK